MTSLAFVLGVLPLMFSSGAGAGARRSMAPAWSAHARRHLHRHAVHPLFFVLVARSRRKKEPG